MLYLCVRYTRRYSTLPVLDTASSLLCNFLDIRVWMWSATCAVVVHEIQPISLVLAAYYVIGTFLAACDVIGAFSIFFTIIHELASKVLLY